MADFLCPFCKIPTKSGVLNSRQCSQGIRRRRSCSICKQRYTTVETHDQTKLLSEDEKILIQQRRMGFPIIS